MSHAESPGFFAKLISVAIGAILLVLGFMFSVVLLAVVLVVGLAVWVWFWWKTRTLRQQIGERIRTENGATYPSRDADGGHVIEGEAVIVEETVARYPPKRLSESPERNPPV